MIDTTYTIKKKRNTITSPMKIIKKIDTDSDYEDSGN